MIKTALEIYNEMLDEYKIKELKGQIKFHLGDVSIIVRRRDVIGNIIQEWVEGWLMDKGVEFDPSDNTQMPPDVYLVPDDHSTGLLEIKAFNRESSPAFDIADFKAFTRELINKPYFLDTDFLIFGYRMYDNGDVIIEDVWLKKIWEITRPSEKWPVNVQYKNDIVHKIRPATWYSIRNSYPVFESKIDFLSAFEEMVFQNPETHSDGGQWANKFKRSYRNHYGEDISFPRWNDIKGRYGL